jgi:hypothetical protein
MSHVSWQNRTHQNKNNHQQPGFDDVMHELNAEPSAEGDHLHRGFSSLRERGVEETETKTILKISNGVDKCRVPRNGVLFT